MYAFDPKNLHHLAAMHRLVDDSLWSLAADSASLYLCETLEGEDVIVRALCVDRHTGTREGNHCGSYAGNYIATPPLPLRRASSSDFRENLALQTLAENASIQGFGEGASWCTLRLLGYKDTTFGVVVVLWESHNQNIVTNEKLASLERKVAETAKPFHPKDPEMPEDEAFLIDLIREPGRPPPRLVSFAEREQQWNAAKQSWENLFDEDEQ